MRWSALGMRDHSHSRSRYLSLIIIYHSYYRRLLTIYSLPFIHFPLASSRSLICITTAGCQRIFRREGRPVLRLAGSLHVLAATACHSWLPHARKYLVRVSYQLQIKLSGWGWLEKDRIEYDWIGLDWITINWFNFNWLEMNQNGMTWIEFDWFQLNLL